MTTKEIAKYLHKSVSWFTFYKKDRIDKRGRRYKAKLKEGVHYVWLAGVCVWNKQEVIKLFGKTK